ncbi:MAG: RrF2 family transcriptional regulator [Candidatus Aminicenantaceae bacterium]
MDLIRRNTDYALCFGLNPALRYGQQPLSARILSGKENIPCQLTCKVLQKLHHTGFMESQRGPREEYLLGLASDEITLTSLVRTAQSPVSLNRCLFEQGICPKQPDCLISKKLSELQESIGTILNQTTLNNLL